MAFLRGGHLCRNLEGGRSPATRQREQLVLGCEVGTSLVSLREGGVGQGVEGKAWGGAVRCLHFL